jgi:uncharacterized protein YndB with AHSA1/START domain
MTQTATVDGQASKRRQAFKMECGVAIHIGARPEKVWALLTNAAEMPKWNSTIQSIEGEIALGKKIHLRVPLAPKRTFKLKIAELQAPRRMVWTDGAAPMFKGVRTFTLAQRSDGTTDFSMVEIFSGLMLPMIAGSLPDFGPSFERYAADLKRAAEQP